MRVKPRLRWRRFIGNIIVEFYRSDAGLGATFNHNRGMFARLSAFVIWSLVAATGVFWAFRFGVSAAQVPPHAVVIGKASPLRGDLARLFGAPPVVAAAAEVTPEATSRFRLIGVMAPKHEPSTPYGLALIAVDGKPAKAYAVGAALDDGLVLQSVGLRTAAIGPPQGERSVLLELPALPAPATGTLPPAASPGSPAPAPAPVAPAPGMRPQAAAVPSAAALPAGLPQPSAPAPNLQPPPQPLPVPGTAVTPPPGVPGREGVQSE